MPEKKLGPMTVGDFQAIWESSTDRAYRDPLLAAGDGSGLEAHGQVWATFARASRAIDVTTQAMYVQPWSGQTNEPAGGPRKATVELTFRRTKRLEEPLILSAGSFLVEELGRDWGPTGTREVLTGRRYALVDDCVFVPGDPGPVVVLAEAERPGYGYNNPMPGDIRQIVQVGEDFNNVDASVAVVPTAGAPLPSTVTLSTINAPDVPIPDHVGQVVLLTTGANGVVAVRMKTFVAPDSTIPRGSVVGLEWIWAFEVNVTAGEFFPGQILTFSTGDVAVLRWVGSFGGGTQLLVEVAGKIGGPPTTGTTISATGPATATVTGVLYEPVFVANAAGTTWRVLDWARDFGLTAENVLSPSGGRLGMLDELGHERNVERASGESDDSYRSRIGDTGDVVSPNAIKRALSRTLGAVPYCFREVGTALLPGAFYDAGDAYDQDCVAFGGTETGTLKTGDRASITDPTGNISYARGIIVRDTGGTEVAVALSFGELPDGVAPANLRVRDVDNGEVFTVTSNVATVRRRRRTYLSLGEFRAFFQVCLPPLGFGEFGFAYDAGLGNAWDVPTLGTNFWDGFAAGTATYYEGVRHAVDVARAGGVHWEMCKDSGPCEP